MGSKAIKYVWKIMKPEEEHLARQLRAAAYQTAVKTDPNVTTVLVRSSIHGTTWKNGQYVKDRPHLTVCVKNSTQDQQKTHETAQGYTKSMKDPTLTDVRPSGYPKPDNTKDHSGEEIWPDGLPSEVIEDPGTSESS
ncbi:MAG: hypothetical protein Q9166_006540 [cf. Caloplaca sp. 2 TL-2023]